MSRYRVKAIRHIKSIPPLSRATLGITQMIADEDYAIDELVGLIETDMTLAGRCLQSINSPLYGLKAQIDTIARAVVLLGARNIAAMALQTALSGVFRMNLEGYDSGHEELWHNGLRTAIGARLITAELLGEPGLADKAYACALMHDLGKIVISELLREIPRERVEEVHRDHAGNFLAAEDALFGTNHAILGQSIAESWHLPESFAMVMRYHHTPSEAPEPFRILALAAHLGDIFSMMAGTHTHLDNMNYPLDPIADEYISRDETWETATFPRLLLEIDDELQKAVMTSGG